LLAITATVVCVDHTVICLARRVKRDDPAALVEVDGDPNDSVVERASRCHGRGNDADKNERQSGGVDPDWKWTPHWIIGWFRMSGSKGTAQCPRNDKMVLSNTCSSAPTKFILSQRFIDTSVKSASVSN
jgi:hypothetical protein